MTLDYLIENCKIVSFESGTKAYGLIEEGAIGIKDGKIVYAASSDAPGTLEAEHTINCVTPGLVDCHTHLVFAGNRAQEFEWRLQGQSYESIAQQGGGIISSVKATRAASKSELIEQSAKRLERLLEEGVTTVEIKSGYGLDTRTELKMLEVAKELETIYPVTVSKTFLGAHSVPPEYQENQQGYVDLVCNEMLPTIAEQNLADAVDVFCEGIAFSPGQCEQIFQKAMELGLPIKGHFEQLSDLKGAVLAASYKALSVDHIEYLDKNDVAALVNTVAVLLPAAFYCLNETQTPPIEALREHQIRMAVATDLNPGTAPMASLLTAMHQACVSFGLTPQEALAGATKNAALALGLPSKGRLKAGFDADLLLWDIEHPAELAYGVNFNRPTLIWQNGNLVGGSKING